MDDPEDALNACRDAGLCEGEWIIDVRAGRCQITTLTATTVTLVPESGQPLDAGDAADLWKFYQRESIFPVDEDSAVHDRSSERE